MADKAFMDSVIRLSALYIEASREDFPIRKDAYPTVTFDQIKDGETIYGLSAYCNIEDEESERYLAVERLHQVWEQALLRRLGAQKNVNADRLLILYQNDALNEDYECVYPAELFKNISPETRQWKRDLFTKMSFNTTQPYIERNVMNQYNLEDTKRYTNYWMALTDDQNEMIGVLGLQVDIKSYNELVPNPVIEMPYSLSFINLYDRDFNSIWWWGCTD